MLKFIEPKQQLTSRIVNTLDNGEIPQTFNAQETELRTPISIFRNHRLQTQIDEWKVRIQDQVEKTLLANGCERQVGEIPTARFVGDARKELPMGRLRKFSYTLSQLEKSGETGFQDAEIITVFFCKDRSGKVSPIVYAHKATSEDQDSKTLNQIVRDDINTLLIKSRAEVKSPTRRAHSSIKNFLFSPMGVGSLAALGFIGISEYAIHKAATYTIVHKTEYGAGFKNLFDKMIQNDGPENGYAHLLNFENGHAYYFESSIASPSVSASTKVELLNQYHQMLRGIDILESKGGRSRLYDWDGRREDSMDGALKKASQSILEELKQTNSPELKRAGTMFLESIDLYGFVGFRVFPFGTKPPPRTPAKASDEIDFIP